MLLVDRGITLPLGRGEDLRAGQVAAQGPRHPPGRLVPVAALAHGAAQGREEVIRAPAGPGGRTRRGLAAGSSRGREGAGAVASGIGHLLRVAGSPAALVSGVPLHGKESGPISANAKDLADS